MEYLLIWAYQLTSRRDLTWAWTIMFLTKAFTFHTLESHAPSTFHFYPSLFRKQVFKIAKLGTP
jgi:hypothetical protein